MLPVPNSSVSNNNTCVILEKDTYSWTLLNDALMDFVPNMRVIMVAEQSHSRGGFTINKFINHYWNICYGLTRIASLGIFKKNEGDVKSKKIISYFLF